MNLISVLAELDCMIFNTPNVRNENIHSLQNVILKVYDVLGCKVAMLVNEKQVSGNYEVTFSTSGLSICAFMTIIYSRNLDLNLFKYKVNNL